MHGSVSKIRNQDSGLLIVSGVDVKHSVEHELVNRTENVASDSKASQLGCGKCDIETHAGC